MTTLGRRVKRVEDPLLVQGHGCYVGDLRWPDTLHAAFVRSPHAHARILEIDSTEARAMPGVIAVYARANLPELASDSTVIQMPPNLRGHGLQPLASDMVRYVGEPIAVVVAEDPYVAADAVEAVWIEFETLAASMSVQPGGEPAIWSDVPGNVAGTISLGYGDLDESFDRADVIIEQTFSFARSAGAAMEPRSVAAKPGGENGVALTIWDSTQIPHGVRDTISAYLGLERDAVHVIAPDVGGGFGVKGRIYPEEYVIPVLALRHNRPVVWVAARGEDLLTTCHGRGQEHTVRMAARHDGTVLTLHDTIVQDAGAYTPNGVQVPLTTARHLMGPYRMSALRADITGIYTNRIMSSPLRGGGRPQGVFVTERMMDRLAQRLCMDRAEVRRRNLLQPDEFPYDTQMPAGGGTTVIYDSGDYPRYLQTALDTIGYGDWIERQREAREQGRYLGLGIVSFIESTGMGTEGASVGIDGEGMVSVAVGSPNGGQGHATTFAQMAAEQLDVPLEQVRVTSGDTQAYSSGTGTFASRMGTFGGNAVRHASLAVRQRMLDLAADMLEIAPDDLEVADGRVSVRGAPEQGVELAAIATRAIEQGAPLHESCTFAPEHGTTWAGGANAAIVEVDIHTGLVQIVRYLVVHDSGTIVNPTVVEGQIHGGVAHGIGNALYEAFVYSDEGQPQTASLADYSIPTVHEVPNIEIQHFETPSPFNPAGIKGAGEGGTIAAIPTIVSAVEDALTPFGIQLNSVPLQPQDLAMRIAEARQSTSA